MNFVGRDADLGTQTIFKTICKTGGCIDHHRAGVHFAQKSAGIGQVLGDDGIGMMRAVMIDVGDRLIKIIDNTDRQYRCQVLGVQSSSMAGIALGNRHRCARSRAAQPLFPDRLVPGWENSFCNIPVYQQGFHGVARCRSDGSWH